MTDLTSMNQYANNLLSKIGSYAPTMFMGLGVLFIGIWVINQLTRYLVEMLKRSNFAPEIRPFLTSLVSIGLKIMLVFSVAGMIGIETASFIAVLGAATFAVGMALQGSLGNLAAGVMILIFKPYKVGDLIKISDQIGKVEEIQVFNTIIVTLDNKTIIVPNSTAIGGIITNFSTKKHLQVDLKIPMPYTEDFSKVEAIVLQTLRQTPKTLATPSPFVGIETFESHTIMLTARVYTTADDYWDVHFEAMKRIKTAFGEHRITVAYPEGVKIGEISR